MRLVLQDLMENGVNGINSGENIFVKVFNLSFKKLCQKREFLVNEILAISRLISLW